MRPSLVILLFNSLVLPACATFNCDWNRLHKSFGTAAVRLRFPSVAI